MIGALVNKEWLLVSSAQRQRWIHLPSIVVIEIRPDPMREGWFEWSAVMVSMNGLPHPFALDAEQWAQLKKGLSLKET